MLRRLYRFRCRFAAPASGAAWAPRGCRWKEFAFGGIHREPDDTPLWDVRFRRECRIGDVGRADSEVPIRIETYGHEGCCIRRARGTSVAALHSAERAGAHRQNAQRKDPGGDFLHSHAVYLLPHDALGGRARPAGASGTTVKECSRPASRQRRALYAPTHCIMRTHV
jgi:hypothetical protein